MAVFDLLHRGNKLLLIAPLVITVMLVASEADNVRSEDVGVRLATSLQSQSIFLDHGGAVQHLEFSTDGRTLLSLGGDIVLWDLDSSKVRRRLLQEKDHYAKFSHMSPNGTYLCSVSNDGTEDESSGADVLRLWDANTGKYIRTLQNDKSPIGKIHFVRFLPNSQSVIALVEPDSKGISSGEPVKSELVQWGVVSGQVERTIARLAVTQIALNQQGTMIAGIRRQSIVIWNLKTGEVVGSFPFAKQSTGENVDWNGPKILFSPTGNTIAVTSGNLFYRWDISRRKSLKPIRIGLSQIEDFSFLSNDNTVVFGGAKTNFKSVGEDNVAVTTGSVVIGQIEKNELMKTHTIPFKSSVGENIVLAVAFDTAKARIAAADDTGSIRIGLPE